MICALSGSKWDHWKSLIWSYPFLDNPPQPQFQDGSCSSFLSSFISYIFPIQQGPCSPATEPSCVLDNAMVYILLRFSYALSLPVVSFPTLPIWLNTSFTFSDFVCKMLPIFLCKQQEEDNTNTVEFSFSPHWSHFFTSSEVNTLPKKVIISPLSSFYKCLNMHVAIKYVVLSILKNVCRCCHSTCLFLQLFFIEYKGRISTRARKVKVSENQIFSP